MLAENIWIVVTLCLGLAFPVIERPDCSTVNDTHIFYHTKVSKAVRFEADIDTILGLTLIAKALSNSALILVSRFLSFANASPILKVTLGDREASQYSVISAIVDPCQLSMADSQQHPRQELRKSFLRRKRIVGGIIFAIVVALAIGLGVGLTQDHDISTPSVPNLGRPSPTANVSVPGNVWKPVTRTSWQYELSAGINETSTNSFEVWDIDLFDNNATMITGLQKNGAKVICYFSAGSYEDWRPDSNKFDKLDLGKDLNGWPGERWLNISSPNVHKIMLARLDLAREKNCDGLDPDNVDGYDNDNGFGLTQADSIDYVRFLADSAHERNLSIGLKNAGAILPNVINVMEWSVNEECVRYNECDVYAPFIQQNKPVFHVEYPKGDSISNNDASPEKAVEAICNNTQAAFFSTIMKNIVLDEWTETCPN